MPPRFSRRLIRQEFCSHLAKYYWKPVLWTQAYGLITAGDASIARVKEWLNALSKTYFCLYKHERTRKKMLWAEPCR